MSDGTGLMKEKVKRDSKKRALPVQARE